MHRDDADALNRALDELASGLPMSGGDVDPNLLATAHWLDDRGRQVSPAPDFVARLEQKLLSDVVPERPAIGAPETRVSAWRSRMRGWSHRGIPVPEGMPEWRWAGALVWVSWAVVVGLVAFALIGPLGFLPGGSDDDQSAMAPGFPLEVEPPVDPASHPIVGSWRVETAPGLPILVAFHADGTYVEVDPLQGTGVGIWRPTGQRSGEVVVEWPNRNLPGRLVTPDPSGIGAKIDPAYLEGWSTMRSTFTVSEDGSTLTGTYHIQQFLPDGDRDPVEPEGSLAGTRIGFDPLAKAPSVDLATHPIVGAWTLQPEVGPASVAAFHADGTYIEVSPLQGTGVGVWRATDASAGEVLVEWPNRNDSGRVQAALIEDGYLEGRTSLESTFTVGEDEMTWSGEYRMQRYYPNGVTYHGEDSAPITGTRIALDSSGVSGDMASHPILGAWIQDTDSPSEGPRVRMIFHADGTYLSTSSCCGSGIGIWQPTDERSGNLIVQFPNRNPPMGGGYVEGTTVLREDFTVADSGSSASGLLHAQYFFPNGVRMVDEPRAEIQATRLIIDPPVSSPAP